MLESVGSYARRLCRRMGISDVDVPTAIPRWTIGLFTQLASRYRG